MLNQMKTPMHLREMASSELRSVSGSVQSEKPTAHFHLSGTITGRFPMDNPSDDIFDRGIREELEDEPIMDALVDQMHAASIDPLTPVDNFLSLNGINAFITGEDFDNAS